MSDFYDVVIVGAGPAGLSCAKILAGKHLSVLVIDKKEQLGIKACGGGITHLAGDFELPADKIRVFRKQTVFLNWLKFTFRLLHPLKTITRTDLSDFQFSEIVNTPNIKILFPVKVKEIHKNYLETDQGILNFKLLVGADGATSQVRKYLGLPSRFRAGYFAKVELPNPKFFWYVNPRKMGSAYIWAFPHKGHSNVGIYYNPATIAPALAKAWLRTFIRKKGGEIQNENITGGVVNGHYSGCEFGNTFLAGDAAGLAILSSGEGISAALISGREVARKILDPNYQMPQLQHVVRVKNRQEKLHRIYERHPFFQYVFYVIFLLANKSRQFQVWFGN